MAHPPKHLHDTAELKRAYQRVRELCIALDRVYEKEAWGEPTFRVTGGKMFLMFADDHHGDGRHGFWSMSSEDAREAWLGIDPERFFVPPYMGPSGWVGVRLEKLSSGVPWEIIEEVIRDAHRLGSVGKAPRTQVAKADKPAKSVSKSKPASRSVATSKAKPASKPVSTAKSVPKSKSPTKTSSPRRARG